MESFALEAFETLFEGEFEGISPVGIEVYDDDVRLGGSPDGMIRKKDNPQYALLEIKCPFSHIIPSTIKPEHYVQIQMNMAIWKVPMTILFYYSPREGSRAFTVNFDRGLWRGSIYPRLLVFIERYINNPKVDAVPRMRSNEKQYIVSEIETSIETHVLL